MWRDALVVTPYYHRKKSKRLQHNERYERFPSDKQRLADTALDANACTRCQLGAQQPWHTLAGVEQWIEIGFCGHVLWVCSNVASRPNIQRGILGLIRDMRLLINYLNPPLFLGVPRSLNRWPTSFLLLKHRIALLLRPKCTHLICHSQNRDAKGSRCLNIHYTLF